jgi:2-keto-4-pentenoate hydratase/2-oxohepta-3-ene-1,7-dioic acid hydratase in catechol pathway
LRDRIDTGRARPVPLSDVRLRAPVPRPVKLLCAQLSFREGVAEAKIAPSFFLKSSTSVIGPDDIVELPAVDAPVFHHEAELAVVIGKRAKNVPASAAMKHVFGYTCFMDLSARGIGPGTGYQDKSYDTFGPMGPWIVTRDEIPDPHALQVRLWVDGELRHDYPMSDIGNPIPEMIASASSIAALEPGDVLAMGVNHQGLGPIQEGDRVRIESDSIGGFDVTDADPLKRRWRKGIDTGAAGAILRMVKGEPMGAFAFAPRLDR